MPFKNVKSVVHIAFFLDNISAIYSEVDVDSNQRTFVKSIYNGEKSYEATRDFVQGLVSGLFPVGAIIFVVFF